MDQRDQYGDVTTVEKATPMGGEEPWEDCHDYPGRYHIFKR